MNKMNEDINIACLIVIINLINIILTMKLSKINQKSKLQINTLIFKINRKHIKYDSLLMRSNNINKNEEQ